MPQVTVGGHEMDTDIKPLEIVFFMRSVKSLSFFEQMKGRGVCERDNLNALLDELNSVLAA